MRTLGLLVSLLAGCYRPASEAACSVSCTTECPGDQVCGPDGRCHPPGTPSCSDQPPIVDVPTGQEVCAGSRSGFLYLCYNVAFGALSVTTPLAIDTDDDTECTVIHHDGRRPICVVAASEIFISNTLTASGSRPLLLWSATTIDITTTGIVDVSSAGTTRRGAGGNAFDCPLALDGADATGAVNQGGGGGAAGASFASRGGAGGASPSTAGAQTAAALDLVSFRGGCRGGAGGAHDGNLGGIGGYGGGGLYLAAATSITLDGKINASGGIAAIAHASAGGGGGGSGGMIVLDAPTVTLGDNALLMAVGGAGSSGGSDGGPGAVGSDASYASYSNMVSGPGNAGDGGAGSNPLFATAGGSGESGTNANGGGGGGGGAGGLNRVFGQLAGTGLDMRPPLTL